MKKLVMVLVLLLSIVNIYAQDKNNVDIEKKPTMHDIQKNSLSIGFHIYIFDALYERAFIIGDKSGFILGGGIQQVALEATNPVGKIGFIFGRYKHFFELGTSIAPLKDETPLFTPSTGYRYQSRGGFFLKVDVALIVDSGTAKDGSGDKWTEVYPFPGLMIGYSF